jgi:hemerythrin
VYVSERYVWKEAFALGIPELDAEHHAFLDLINSVADAVDCSEPGRLQLALADLRTYANVHFAHEEQFLEAAACPELARQRAEHALFVVRLDELDRAVHTGARAALDLARSWLIDHILGSDRECAAWLHASEVRVPYPLAV